jgi:hypothetical protein
MARVYDRLSKFCRTINQLNSLHIAMERRMTPAEQLDVIRYLEARLGVDSTGWRRAPRSSKEFRGKISRFYPAFRQARAGLRRRIFVTKRALKPALRSVDPKNRKAERSDIQTGQVQWLKRLSTSYMIRRIGENQIPVRWQRIPTEPRMSLYKSNQYPSQTLVVSFTGRTGRMMSGLPDYLHILESLPCDVLLVHESFQENNLSSDGPTLISSRPQLERLQKIVEALNYSEIYSVGTSAGATSALLSSLYINPTSVLAVGPTSGAFEKLTTKEKDGIARVAQQGDVSLMIAYGADSIGDRKVARWWESTVPAQIIAVSGANHPALLPLDEQFGVVKLLTGKVDVPSL